MSEKNRDHIVDVNNMTLEQENKACKKPMELKKIEEKIEILKKLAKQNNSNGTTFVDGQINAAKYALGIIFELINYYE